MAGTDTSVLTLATTATPAASESEAARSTPGEIFFTRGAELISPRAFYQRAFESETLRQISRSYLQLDDATLMTALGASATAYACADYRATISADLALAAKVNGEKADWSPFANFFILAPRLLYHTVLSMLVWGRAYLLKEYNPSGYPTGLRWLNPLEVREVNANGVVDHYIVREPGFQLKRYDLRQIIYIQSFDPNPDGRGYSKLELAFRAIGIEQGLAVYAAAFFVNAARPDGMLVLPPGLSPTEIERARTSWLEFKTSQNAHRTAVMPGGVEWKPIQSAPKDLMMSELKQEQRIDIAAIMRTDLQLIGVVPVADPLSAQGTFDAKKVAHITDVAIPFLRHFVLNELNRQWAMTDFERAYTLDVNEMAISALAEMQLSKADTATALTTGNAIDYDEARRLIGQDPRGDAYFARPVNESIQVWQTGGLTLNELRDKTGAGETWGEAGEIVMLGNVAVPKARLLEVANANVDRLKNPPMFGLSTPPTPPQAPVPDTPPALPPGDMERDDENDTSFFMALDLADDPDLMSLQRSLAGLYPDTPIQWTPSDDYHITLIYAPAATPEQVATVLTAIRAIPVPKLSFRLGSLRLFKNPGECALHFRLRGMNATMREYQRKLHHACRSAGLALSSYSDPVRWIPHITMGYSPTEVQTHTWTSAISIECGDVKACHGIDVVVYEASANTPQVTVAPPEPTPQMPTVPEPVRSATPLEMCVPFAENAFVRAAQTELSAWLIGQGMTQPVTWQSSYALALASLPNVTPAIAGRILREVDYAETRKIDVMSAGFAQLGSDLYLVVPDSEPLAALRESSVIELSAYGDSQAVTQPGVLIGRFQSDAPTLDLSSAPVGEYPLVISAVELRWNQQTRQQWTLRGQSLAQTKDLENWRRWHAKGKGVDFVARSLPPTVTAFIRLGLENTDIVDSDDVFTTAQAMLRSYRDTRAAYIADITTLLDQASRQSISGQAFSSRMFATLSRYGLQTLNDAYADAKVAKDSIDPDTLTMFRAWEQEQRDFIKNVRAEFFKEGGTLSDASMRAELWANKSLDDLYYTMLRNAAPLLEVTWHRNPPNDSCSDCIERDGVTFTMEEWGKIGFPRDRRLACSGWKCACWLSDSEGKTYRAFRNEPEPDYSPLGEFHDHEHEAAA